MTTRQSSDSMARHYPVSIKGVAIVENKVVLLKNERDEWELPGGKLEAEEVPERCCEREILEETGLQSRVSTLLDCWVYRIFSVDVVIITYGCQVTSSSAALQLSNEHKELRLFARDGLQAIPIPQGYLRAIYRWFDTPKLER